MPPKKKGSKATAEKPTVPKRLPKPKAPPAPGTRSSNRIKKVNPTVAPDPVPAPQANPVAVQSANGTKLRKTSKQKHVEDDEQRALEKEIAVAYQDEHGVPPPEKQNADAKLRKMGIPVDAPGSILPKGAGETHLLAPADRFAFGKGTTTIQQSNDGLDDTTQENAKRDDTPPVVAGTDLLATPGKESSLLAVEVVVMNVGDDSNSSHDLEIARFTHPLLRAIPRGSKGLVYCRLSELVPMAADFYKMLREPSIKFFSQGFNGRLSLVGTGAQFFGADVDESHKYRQALAAMEKVDFQATEELDEEFGCHIFKLFVQISNTSDGGSSKEIAAADVFPVKPIAETTASVKRKHVAIASIGSNASTKVHPPKRVHTAEDHSERDMATNMPAQPVAKTASFSDLRQASESEYTTDDNHGDDAGSDDDEDEGESSEWAGIVSSDEVGHLGTSRSIGSNDDSNSFDSLVLKSEGKTVGGLALVDTSTTNNVEWTYISSDTEAPEPKLRDVGVGRTPVIKREPAEDGDAAKSLHKRHTPAPEPIQISSDDGNSKSGSGVSDLSQDEASEVAMPNQNLPPAVLAEMRRSSAVKQYIIRNWLPQPGLRYRRKVRNAKEDLERYKFIAHVLGEFNRNDCRIPESCPDVEIRGLELNQYNLQDAVGCTENNSTWNKCVARWTNTVAGLDDVQKWMKNPDGPGKEKWGVMKIAQFDKHCKDRKKPSTDRKAPPMGAFQRDRHAYTSDFEPHQEKAWEHGRYGRNAEGDRRAEQFYDHRDSERPRHRGRLRTPDLDLDHGPLPSGSKSHW